MDHIVAECPISTENNIKDRIGCLLEYTLKYARKQG
jgi:hypothetical protein